MATTVNTKDIVELFKGPVGWVIVGVVGYFLLKNVFQGIGNAASAVGSGLESAAGSVAGAVSNVNAGTDYSGTGVIGTLGHATDVASGGTLSNIGESVGSWLYDTFHPSGNGAGNIPTSDQTEESSGSLQSYSARPYQNGNNAAYATAYSESPPDPAYTPTAALEPQFGLTTDSATQEW